MEKQYQRVFKNKYGAFIKNVKLFLRGDKLDKLLELLFAPVINDSAAWLGQMFSGLAQITLNVEYTLWGTSYNNDVMATALSRVQKLCLEMAVAMIILKFLKKGFETYVLWTDGDADADPILLATSFFKALATAMSFPVLYGFLVEITQNFTEAVRIALGVASKYDWYDPSGLLSTGLFNLLGLLVALILLIVLFMQFVKRGVEMFVLRLAFPIGCIGLMDSDKAMYKSMCQKIFQCAATIVVQVGLSQLALSIIFAKHTVVAIAVIAAALGTPKFLQEFMVPSTGGVNSATVYQVSRLVQMTRGVLRR